MSSCAGTEGSGSPPFLLYWHLAGGAGPEWAELLMWLPGEAELEAEAERVAVASVAAAAGKRKVGVGRSGGLVGWRCPCWPCFAGW